jgi:hypothetical protein
MSSALLCQVKGPGLSFQWLESSECQGRPLDEPYPWVGPAHSLRCTDTSVKRRRRNIAAVRARRRRAE